MYTIVGRDHSISGDTARSTFELAHRASATYLVQERTGETGTTHRARGTATAPATQMGATGKAQSLGGKESMGHREAGDTGWLHILSGATTAGHSGCGATGGTHETPGATTTWHSGDGNPPDQPTVGNVMTRARAVTRTVPIGATIHSSAGVGALGKSGRNASILQRYRAKHRRIRGLCPYQFGRSFKHSLSCGKKARVNLSLRAAKRRSNISAWERERRWDGHLARHGQARRLSHFPLLAMTSSYEPWGAHPA